MSTQSTKKYTHDELFGPPPRPLFTIMTTIGLLIIVAATLVPLLYDSFQHPWFRYLYAAGAALTLAGRLFTPYRGTHPRMKRLSRLESWSGIFFCVAAFFMFYDTHNNRDWLAFTLAGGAVQILTTILTTRIAKKELTR